MLDDSTWLLPQALRAAGYQTCHVGKWHVTADPLKNGMEVNIGGYEGGHPKSYFSPYKNPNLTDGPEGEYLMDRLASEVVRYIDTVSRERPFFSCIMLLMQFIHLLQAKPELIEKYKRKPATKAHNNPVYAAMVESMDTGIGRVLDAVEKEWAVGKYVGCFHFG